MGGADLQRSLITTHNAHGTPRRHSVKAIMTIESTSPAAASSAVALTPSAMVEPNIPMPMAKSGKTKTTQQSAVTMKKPTMQSRTGRRELRLTSHNRPGPNVCNASIAAAAGLGRKQTSAALRRRLHPLAQQESVRPYLRGRQETVFRSQGDRNSPSIGRARASFRERLRVQGNGPAH